MSNKYRDNTQGGHTHYDGCGCIGSIHLTEIRQLKSELETVTNRLAAAEKVIKAAVDAQIVSHDACSCSGGGKWVHNELCNSLRDALAAFRKEKE